MFLGDNLSAYSYSEAHIADVSNGTLVSSKKQQDQLYFRSLFGKIPVKGITEQQEEG